MHVCVFQGDVWKPLPATIMGVLGLIVGMFAFFLPETLGQKLPATVAEAELIG